MAHNIKEKTIKSKEKKKKKFFFVKPGIEPRHTGRCNIVELNLLLYISDIADTISIGLQTRIPGFDSRCGEIFFISREALLFIIPAVRSSFTTRTHDSGLNHNWYRPYNGLNMIRIVVNRVCQCVGQKLDWWKRKRYGMRWMHKEILLGESVRCECICMKYKFARFFSSFCLKRVHTHTECLCRILLSFLHTICIFSTKSLQRRVCLACKLLL